MRGAKVMHMVATLADVVAAVEAGADVVVAQGSEGGGHVGEMGTTCSFVRSRRWSRPFPPSPRAASPAGRSAAALALGADGIPMGTRFPRPRSAP